MRTTTPYTTAKDYLGQRPEWVPEEERERIGSYLLYDDMYWSQPDTFKVILGDKDSNPLYVPKARTVVDTTSHYLLKGLSISSQDAQLQQILEDTMKREEFLTRFHVAKHSGVTRGDFLLHITADDTKEPGKRISITSVHPASYFPVWDTWDPDKLLRVHLAEQFEVRENSSVKTYLRKLTYEYVYEGNNRRVKSSEGVFEVEDWFDPKKEKKIRDLIQTKLLPEDITVIPVYHFKNGQWQGRDYGTSEISGFESILNGINQTMTDEEMMLALEGLGVYATDAAGPVDESTGRRVPWEIAPARVMELPTGSFFNRVKGVDSVKPMLDHVQYIEDSLYEASGTTDIARGIVDVQIAQSGIALAIRFLPTLAKLEERDRSGINKLEQFWYDFKFWWNAFEDGDFRERDIDVAIGDKLPTDRVGRLNELNNMYDRKVISAKFYRAEMTKLGYDFPEDIEDQLAAEAEQRFQEAQKLAMLNQTSSDSQDSPDSGKSGVGGRPQTAKRTKQQSNRSNNSGRPNESGGSEAK
jgi:hypothetical protein